MADEKVTSNGNVTVWWVPSAGLSDYRAPLATEINAGVNLTQAIAWDSFELAASDSNDVEDRSLADIGNSVTRGFQQFAASMNFFRDVDSNDAESPYVQAFETFRVPRAYGYLILRVLQAGAGEDATAGEWVSVFRFVSDAVGDDTEGEDSYKLTVTFLPQGEVAVYTQVTANDEAAVSVDPATLEVAVDEHGLLTAELRGKDITQGATWRSSNTSVASVSANGVVTGVSAGTAEITATHRSADGGAGTATVTVA